MWAKRALVKPLRMWRGRRVRRWMAISTPSRWCFVVCSQSRPTISKFCATVCKNSNSTTRQFRICPNHPGRWVSAFVVGFWVCCTWKLSKSAWSANSTWPSSPQRHRCNIESCAPTVMSKWLTTRAICQPRCTSVVLKNHFSSSASSRQRTTRVH